MPFSPNKENQHSSSFWFKNKKSLNNVLSAMRFNSQTPKPLTAKTHLPDLVSDKTCLFSDEILLKILAKIPKSQRNSNLLVNKRWLNLQGSLVRTLKLLDWEFLISGRIFLRFPNLTHIDLIHACLVNPQSNGVVITSKIVSFDSFHQNSVLGQSEIDKGLRVLASVYPNLRKLSVVNASEMGLLSVAEACPTLQELSLHACNDQVLRGIAAFQSLQNLRIYGASVSDIGLTILAQGCKMLTKLEMSGCRGSYEGVRGIGQCCPMLEELTLSFHEMEDGWLSALSFCDKLRSLRLVSCKRIDGGNDVEEDLGVCRSIGSLHLEKCQLRDGKSLKALFVMCGNARELTLKNCWGLSDDLFSTATVLRKVSSVSLEGCSLLTAQGVETVISHWKLNSLTVKSCNNIRDLSSVFFGLKNFKWEAHAKSRVLANLEGTGVGKRGSKFFHHSCDWKQQLQTLQS